ncbi:MAG: hypothetical protein KKH98_02610 [Spirochaetes bacterium]|nr:hypothetical protein [Spirochaetota bacterium]
MKRRLFITIIILLLFKTSLISRSISYNWFWGIENIGSDSYFMVDLKPGFNYGFFSLKLDIPIEISSNGSIYKNHWDSPYDIITKIDHLTYTNQTHYVKILTLQNIIMGNGELIHFYSNDLFTPLLIKKGASGGLILNNFVLKLIIDDIYDFDIFFSDMNYHSDSFKGGMTFSYDADIQDPYSEEPIDNKGSISFVDLYFNVFLLLGNSLKLTLENDAIKSIKSEPYKGNWIFATGPNIKLFHILDITGKFKYYQEGLPGHVIFNKLYEVERGSYERVTRKESMGLSGELKFILTDSILFMLFLERTEELSTYSIVKFQLLKNFPVKIKFDIEFHNRDLKEWFSIIEEKEKDTFSLLKSHVALSEHLSIHLDYLKSFSYDTYSLRGLHQVLFYSEFLF